MYPRRFYACVPLLAFAVWSAGCSAHPGAGRDAAIETKSIYVAQPAAAGVSTASAPLDAGKTAETAPQPRKIVYTATVDISTATFPQTVATLQDSVKRYGGYIAETNVTATPGEPRNGTWKIRIPVAEFDRFMASLGKIGEISTTSITSEDVSEEFYDVAARLKNKQREEERLLQLLQNATGKLAEILTVEKEISRVREEIERMEGRIRFLSHQADLTTITLNLHELPTLTKQPDAPTFAALLQRTLVGSLVAMADVAKSLLLVVVALLPWAVIVSGIALPLYAVARKRRKQGDARTNNRAYLPRTLSEERNPENRE